MADPQVDATDLDKQIEEMLGGMERVEGASAPAPAPAPEPSPKPSEAAVEPPRGEVPPPTPAPSSEGDRLAAALSAIDNLTKEVQELRSQRTSPVPSTPSRPEPSIEFEEVLGRRVPKDRSQRAIKVQAEDLLRLGWNDDPAKVIELMGNALFDFIMEVVPSATTQTWQARSRAEADAAARINSFWSTHEDLKDLQPFVKTVEDMSLADGSLNPAAFSSQNEYSVALGRKVREKVAAMRGLSYDQYLAAISRPGSAPAPSRAVTTGGGSPRAARSPAPQAGSQQAEIDDLLNNR